ncbi:hypothetical protein MYX82_11500 [Acidobacteria bacterium AH-259-D05]|nr:hypothetical protein [Acidobacteria bacterium AH-259-D05]
MPRVFINGLWPGHDQPDSKGGMRVSLFLKDDFASKEATLLFESYSNGKKNVDGNIDDKYIGKEVIIIITEPGFQYKYPTLKLKRIGLFHTAPLEKDFVYRDEMVKTHPDFVSFDCTREYAEAQAEMHTVARAARYKNLSILVGFTIITFGAPFLGLTLAGVPGVVVGIIIAALLWWLSPYASGLKSHHKA